MKKLMIAAAAAAMVGGAFAGDFAGLYNLKFTLKTLAPKQTTCKTDCTICDPATRSAGNYYENGTVKLEGIIAYCSECTVMGENFADAALALWDPTNKEPVYFADSWKSAKTVPELIDAAEKAGEDIAVTNVFTMIDTTVYGKCSNKVGMDFVMDWKDYDRSLYTNDEYDVRHLLEVGNWDLRAAGLGTWCWQNNDEGYVKSVSGNVAGRIPAATGYTGTKGSGSYWGATIVANECSGAADYCKVSYEADPTDGGNWEHPINEGDKNKNYSVPAYGTWSIKYNSSATKKELYKSLPSYAQNF